MRQRGRISHRMFELAREFHDGQECQGGTGIDGLGIKRHEGDRKRQGSAKHQVDEDLNQGVSGLYKVPGKGSDKMAYLQMPRTYGKLTLPHKLWLHGFQSFPREAASIDLTSNGARLAKCLKPASYYYMLRKRGASWPVNRNSKK